MTYPFIFSQLLAALLITRQVVGNIKESIIPYAKKHFKLAQLSFDRYGALSPTEEKQNTAISEDNISRDSQHCSDDKKCEETDTDDTPVPQDNGRENKSMSPRKFSQVECESSAPPVSIKKQ